jgi:hypothetical protein
MLVPGSKGSQLISNSAGSPTAPLVATTFCLASPDESTSILAAYRVNHVNPPCLGSLSLILPSLGQAHGKPLQYFR